MTFEEVLAQIIEVLQREKRISYRASNGGLHWTTPTWMI